MPDKKSQKGSLMVEIVIVASIIAGSLAVVVGLAAFFVATSHMVQQTSRATALAQEALEIVRNYRDGTDWATNGLGFLTAGSDYYPEESVGQWQFTPGTESVDEFTRKVVFSSVCRDGSDNIGDCPASYADADTKKATATVSWTERGNNHQVELVAYFTNWRQ